LVPNDRITVTETLARLRADRQRLRAFLEDRPYLAAQWLWLSPSYQAVFLHRWSHYFYRKRRRLLARFLWHVNLVLTGADISPISDIGPGLVLAQPVAVILVGKAGCNLLVHAHASIGGGMSSEDIGFGAGLPILGDDVVLEFSALVLGPVRIGNAARIGAQCFIKSDLPDCAQVIPRKPKILRSRSSSAVEGEVANDPA
jgi:serine O-acetyltransferase